MMSQIKSLFWRVRTYWWPTRLFRSQRNLKSTVKLVMVLVWLKVKFLLCQQCLLNQCKIFLSRRVFQSYPLLQLFSKKRSPKVVYCLKKLFRRKLKMTKRCLEVLWSIWFSMSLRSRRHYFSSSWCWNKVQTTHFLTIQSISRFRFPSNLMWSIRRLVMDVEKLQSKECATNVQFVLNSTCVANVKRQLTMSTVSWRLKARHKVLSWTMNFQKRSSANAKSKRSRKIGMKWHKISVKESVLTKTSNGSMQVRSKTRRNGQIRDALYSSVHLSKFWLQSLDTLSSRSLRLKTRLVGHGNKASSCNSTMSVNGKSSHWPNLTKWSTLMFKANKRLKYALYYRSKTMPSPPIKSITSL